jgi:iron complex outermembrane receptor protein
MSASLMSAAFAQAAIELPPITVTSTKPQDASAPAATDSSPSPQAPQGRDGEEDGGDGEPAIKSRYQLPQTSEGATAQRIEQTTNIVDSADAVKYLPSLFVRKRNDGDNQEVLATRSWGVSSSARSLVYADDMLLSALIGNNNSSATPRWGMVAPEEIKRVDFLYGPFSAAYPGNAMGGVLIFTTRMPDKPEFTFKQSESFQTFDFYKTSDTYRTDQSSLSFGNRLNDFSFFISGNAQNSYSQPLSWVTSTTGTGIPAGTSGAIPALSRTGGTQTVLGAGGLLHTRQANLKGKFAVDLTDWLTATYTIGYWSNDQLSDVQSYLTDAGGNPTFGGNASGVANGAGFASNYYNLHQKNLANALSLKTDTRGAFDWDIALLRYDYLQDIQRNPFTVAATGASFIDTGRITRFDGTNWMTLDAKGIWRTNGPLGSHEVSFGVHGDRYELRNPTYRTDTWDSGPDSTDALYTDARGKTQTVAVWAQDAWRFAPQYKLTVGGRFESWRAFDGFNLTTATNAQTGAITSTTALAQPSLGAERFSPKASLSWEPAANWDVTASFGVANRFPTVLELYQATSVGVNLVNPNPNLAPEKSFSGELAIERTFSDGKVRLSFFQDDTRDALIAQNSYSPATNTTTSFITNVDRVRNRGVELAWRKDNALFDRVDLFGSVTYVDSTILSDPTFVGTGGSTAVGKRAPYVPMWRSTLGATWRPLDAWSFTAVGRYQSKMYATLDNIDTVANVYQAFDPFFVVDLRVQYQLSEHGSLSFGVDNVNNAQYHLFHPFPQRTFVMQGRLTF